VIGGAVLDATAIRDIAAGQTVYGQAFVSAAIEQGLVLLVPATALSQAWATLPDDALPLLELFLSRPVVVVDDLDAGRARKAAMRVRALPDADLRTAESHVVHAARVRGWRVLTRAPERLREIDPAVPTESPPSD
jgi:hypothetical protein